MKRARDSSMNRWIIVVLTSFIAGCAMTPEQASQKTSFELCEILVRGHGPNLDIARNSLANRNYDCRNDIPVIAAKIQAEAAASAAFVQGLLGASAVINASQPRPVQQPYPQTIIIQQPYQPPPLVFPRLPQPRVGTPNVCAIGSICR